MDGGGHFTPEQVEKDQIRTKELENMNLTVVRICNLDVDKNFRGVCEYIDGIIEVTTPQSKIRDF